MKGNRPLPTKKLQPPHEIWVASAPRARCGGARPAPLSNPPSRNVKEFDLEAAKIVSRKNPLHEAARIDPAETQKPLKH